MITKSKREETFPRQKFLMVISSADLKNKQTLGVAKVKELMRVKDNIIHDKKAEICGLREEIENLKALIEWLMGQMHTKSK